VKVRPGNRLNLASVCHLWLSSGVDLIRILLRNLPSFSSLKDDDKVLVTRKTPKLDGLLSVQKLRESVSVTWNSLANRPTSFPPSAHSHTEGEILNAIGTGGQIKPELIPGGGGVAALVRSAELGPPEDVSYQTVVIGLGSFTNYSAVNTYEVEWDGQETLEFSQGCIPPVGYVALTQAWATNLGAIPEVAAEWNISASGAFVTMTRKTGGTLTGFSLTRISGIATALTIESLEDTPSVTGTPADALDQACIVGDAGKNKLEYRAVQVEPAQWQLVTAGVIWNEDDAQFEKLVVRDGTIQTDLYLLS